MPILSLPMRLLCWVVLGLLVAPSVLVIPMAFSPTTYVTFPMSSISFRWFYQFFSDPQWREASWRSVRIACTVTITATTIATVAFLFLSKIPRTMRQFALALIISPMIIPIIAYSVAVYGVFAKLGLIGTDLALIIAPTVLAVPIPFL